VACALGCEVMKIVSKKAFLKNVGALGRYLKERLATFEKKYPLLQEVRGSGLLIGAQMQSDPKPLVAACKKNGLLMIAAGANTVRFLPPLIVTKKEIDAALAIFEKCIKGL